MSELTFACSMSNPDIRATIKGGVQDISWTSEVARHVIDFYLGESGEAATLVELQTYLASKSLTEEEINTVTSKCKEFVLLDEQFAITNIIGDFQEFFDKRKLTEKLELYRDGKLTSSDVIRALSDLPKIESEEIPVINFGDVDIDKIIEQDGLGGANVIPSKFQFVRESSPWQGYIKGQVIQVVAAPGVGKSNWMANEIVNAIKTCQTEVYYLALGDLMRIDFVTRMTALITGADYFSVCASPKKYYSDEVKNILKHLRVSVLPAAYMDAKTMQSFVNNKVQREKNIDIFALDYDANLNGTQESSYKEGEIVYNTLSQVSRPVTTDNRLVFVASQPKIQYWDEVELPMESSNDSSRKQAVIDMMVTIGRDSSVRSQAVGIMKAAKVRRGKPNTKSHFRVNSNGQFEEISSADYMQCKSFTGS